jgi:hypothetical protein
MSPVMAAAVAPQTQTTTATWNPFNPTKAKRAHPPMAVAGGAKTEMTAGAQWHERPPEPAVPTQLAVGLSLWLSVELSLYL